MMDLTPNARILLHKLAQLPFIDYEELAFLSDLAYSKVHRAIADLERWEFIGHFFHSIPGSPRRSDSISTATA